MLPILTPYTIRSLHTHFILKNDWIHNGVPVSDFLSGLFCSVLLDAALIKKDQAGILCVAE